MSWKSELKSYIVSIEPNIKKRDIKIYCTNKNAGKRVLQIIEQQHNFLAPGYKVNKYKGEKNAKDFIICMEIRDGAQAMYDGISAILADNSIQQSEEIDTRSGGEKLKDNLAKVGASVKDIATNVSNTLLGGGSTVTSTPVTSPMSNPTATLPAATSGMPAAVSGKKSNTALIIAGVAVLLILAGLVIWKKRKK